jgi:magnesium-transporting ATPase (P-type)
MSPDVTSPAGAPLPDWHALPIGDVQRALDLVDSARGLSAADAAGRLARHGPNALPVPSRVTLPTIILHQFLSPLIYILLAAAVVALALRDYVDAGFIILIVCLNAALGTVQEYKAEKSAEGLQSLLRVQSRVRRDGHDVVLPADDLVPGDVVLLESGNRVPADLRLFRAQELAVDESLLTGESVAVPKSVEPLDAGVAVADRRNMTFAGTTVVTGRGAGVVVATGTRTEVGRIARTVADTGVTKPPLVLRMERFARQISVIILGACVAVGAVGVAKGMGLAEVFFLTVALAVSAIPEGLPVAVTVALSIATARMARRRVIVRHLAAVEGLGSCTFIASDKTGTLTVNSQTARRLVLPSGEHLHVTGEGYAGVGAITTDTGGVPDEALAARARALVRVGVICNEGTLQHDETGWHFTGDAVDAALLALGHKAGVVPDVERAALTVVREIPFESERAWAATFFQEGGRARVAIKGALEALLPHCTTMRLAGGDVPVDAALLEQQAHELSSTGHRFLLLAEGDADAGASAGAGRDGDLPPLTVLGLVGLIDPPRPEARTAVAQCVAAGITVAMVTGDHPLTAFAIARELGIGDDESQIVTGRQLEAAGAADGAAFDALVRRGRVFARVTPVQKLQLVEALRRLGHFVAVTGDGVNDAPALRAANISVAMGSGSDVTKDTASLIVTDDNFASIVAGVEEGRFAYDNIRKVTYLLISTGAAEVALLILALLVGLPVPLVAVQLLWLNLVTNGIQDISLAFEGGEPGAMRRPPRRPAEGIFNRKMIAQVTMSGVVMGGIALLFWAKLLDDGVPVDSARNRLLLLFVLMQNVHVFNCRSEYQSAFAVPLARNRVLAAGVPTALLVHVAVMHVPVMQPLLRVYPLAPAEWVQPVLLALTVLVAMEGYKLLARRVRGTPREAAAPPAAATAA